MSGGNVFTGVILSVQVVVVGGGGSHVLSEGVPQSLVPRPFWGYSSDWYQVPSGKGTPGEGYPLAMTGVFPSQDWGTFLARTRVTPGQNQQCTGYTVVGTPLAFSGRRTFRLTNKLTRLAYMVTSSKPVLIAVVYVNNNKFAICRLETELSTSSFRECKCTWMFSDNLRTLNGHYVYFYTWRIKLTMVVRRGYYVFKCYK